MDMIHIMEWLTIAVTLLMFMTGIAPCSNMYKTGSTRNVPYLIFLMGAVGCLGMFHYGMLINNTTLIFLNGVGSILQTFYVLMYISVVQSKSQPLTYLLIAGTYLSGLYYYLCMIVVEEQGFADTLGKASSLLTTVIMCIPALEIIGNIRNKNADGMPKVMLYGGLACSTCWLIYGLMLRDPNIYRPNIPGLVITVAKLLVIHIYDSPRKAKTS